VATVTTVTIGSVAKVAWRLGGRAARRRVVLPNVLLELLDGVFVWYAKLHVFLLFLERVEVLGHGDREAWASHALLHLELLVAFANLN
jgi:hypothetical protein